MTEKNISKNFKLLLQNFSLVSQNFKLCSQFQGIRQTNKQKNLKKKKENQLRRRKKKKVEKWLSQFETFLVSGGEI